MLAEAAAAGATILKPARNTFWGGYAGYFADPDGHAWGGRLEFGLDHRSVWQCEPAQERLTTNYVGQGMTAAEAATSRKYKRRLVCSGASRYQRLWAELVIHLRQCLKLLRGATVSELWQLFLLRKTARINEIHSELLIIAFQVACAKLYQRSLPTPSFRRGSIDQELSVPGRATQSGGQI